MPKYTRERLPRPSEEVELLARLRAGDERAFEALVERHYRTMLAVARTYVKTREVAEEVVQEAWIGVLKGLEGFEGRASSRSPAISSRRARGCTRTAMRPTVHLLAPVHGAYAPLGISLTVGWWYHPVRGESEVNGWS
jgi:hypothetical protein